MSFGRTEKTADLLWLVGRLYRAHNLLFQATSMFALDCFVQFTPYLVLTLDFSSRTVCNISITAQIRIHYLLPKWLLVDTTGIQTQSAWTARKCIAGSKFSGIAYPNVSRW